MRRSSPRTRRADRGSNLYVDSRRRWSRLRAALLVWGALLGINLVAGWLSRTSLSASLLDCLATGTAILAVVGLTAADRHRLLPLLAWRTWSWRTLWLVPAFLLAFEVFFRFYLGMWSWLGVPTVNLLDTTGEDGWPVWTAFVLIAVAPALLEEYAIRGFMYGRLREVMSRNEALYAQAALFSVLHMSPLVFISHFLLGLALGWLRERGGSLLQPILLHMLWNGWVLTAELLQLR